MVSDIADPELQDNVDGFDADDDASLDALNETEPQDEEEEAPDPLAELRERLDKAATRDELEQIRTQVRSELGRAQKFEARLNEIVSRDPLAALDPRLSVTDEVLSGIVDALIASDLTDDQSKASLRAARTRLDQATSARAQERMRRELLEEVRGAQAPQQTPDENDPWLVATSDVVEEAQRLGYDPAKIPQEVWATARATGRPTLAVRNVLKWVEDAMESEDTPATRVAERRRAAGRGSPPRSGAAMNNMDLIERYGQGDPTITAEQADAAMRAEGLK